MFRRSRNRSAVVLSLALALAGPTTSLQAASQTVSRVAGADRYATAVAVSKQAWPSGAEVAFVATGLKFADSVAVAAVSGDAGPVLLTLPGSLPAVTRAELQRLQPDVVFVLGGPNAVSQAVQLEIVKSLPGTGIVVHRIAGKDRFETAVAISNQLRPEATTVFLADGLDYAGGITAAVSAGINDGVLLTTPAGSLPLAVEAELARIKPATLIAVGNLSSAVVSAAGRHAASVQWIKASSAVELSAKLSAATWASTEDVLIASAADFPDALASAAWAVSANVPLLLTNPARLEPATACEVLRMHATEAIIVGGPNAVSQTVANALLDIKPRAYGCTAPLLVTIPDPLPSTEKQEVTLYEMTTSPDSTRAYVINNSWNSIEVIDVVEGTWLGRIAVGSNPVDVDISADGRWLYVVNNGSQTISVIDTTAPFARAEVNQIFMRTAGANSRRTYSIDATDTGEAIILPSVLEGPDADGCVQLLSGSTIREVEPGLNPNIPYGAVQAFHSTDHRLVGVIAPDRGLEPPSEPLECPSPDDPAPSPSPSPSPSSSPSEPTDEPTLFEEQSLALFTYVNRTWRRVGAWGRPVSEIAYGKYDELGVSSDGTGTATVFDATNNQAAVLGTVTSESSSTYGLAVATLQPRCPQNRGNPAQCTQLAYNVVAGPNGTGAVDVLDVTDGRNVAGSFRVIEQIPLQSLVGPYGSKNQPAAPELLNQATVTADGRSLVVATEFAVEIIPIG